MLRRPKQKLDDAGRVQAGDRLTLQDARAMATSDTRIATLIYHVPDKMYGFSGEVDTYMGPAHRLAAPRRSAVAILDPVVVSLVSYYATPSEALRMGLRIKFGLQQITFRWIRARLAQPDITIRVPDPDFSGLAADVSSLMMGSVPMLPHAWNNLIREENNQSGVERIRGGGNGNGVRKRTNPHWDSDIKVRWERTGFDKTSQMTRNFSGGGNARDSIPQFSDGAQVCLNLACKGECNDGCPRSASHKRMGAPLIQSVHGFMDQCGVARP